MQENAFQVHTLPAFPRKGFVFDDFPAFTCILLAQKTRRLVVTDSGEVVENTDCSLSLMEYLWLDVLGSSETEQTLKLEAKLLSDGLLCHS